MSRRPRQPNLRGSLSSVLAVMLMIAGCQSEPVHPATAKEVATAGKLPADDPCVNQLHDLCGYLLQYSIINKQLPTTLEQLRPMVDADKQLPLNCPKSGKPYRYHPNGLIAPGDKRLLILVDPEPSHSGYRLAIVATPPEPELSKPVSLWVVQIPDAAMKLYAAP